MSGGVTGKLATAYYVDSNEGLGACRESPFMRTQKQIAASRENRGESHGAATAEGKARIVNANLQPASSRTQVLVWEFQEISRNLGTNTTPAIRPLPPSALPPRPNRHVRMVPSPLVSVEDALWMSLHCQPAEPRRVRLCLQQGDRTFTRLQHRINSTAAPSTPR